MRRSLVAGLGALALVAAVLVVVVVGSGSGGNSLVPAAAAAPIEANRSLQAQLGQFIAVCPFSHSAPNDPIVHKDMPGMSHLHEFFGNATTDAASTFDALVSSSSNCSDAGDRSAYWAPALFLDGKRVQPRRVDVYYRVPVGVEARAVKPIPKGLQALAGNQKATGPQPLGIVAWTCGMSPELSSQPPDNCGPDRPLRLRLTFPSCWDGEHVATEDHVSHLSYPTPKGCPVSHPVPIPQVTMVVHYPKWGPLGSVRLASGDVYTAHGDFFDGWQPERMRDQVRCLNLEVMCGLPGGTFHTGLGSGDDDHYSLPGTGDGYTY